MLVEELGRHAAPAPFVSTVLALDALAQRRRTARGSSGSWPVTRSRASRGIAAAPVPYAPSADVAVVLADDGVYAIELTERPPREPAMDLTRELGWLPAATACALDR